MQCHRLRLVCGLIVATYGLGNCLGTAFGQTQAMPTMTAPPQQMRANEAPSSYPSTPYPATASPATSSPATSNPATSYPTTAATDGPALGSSNGGRYGYRSALPGIEAAPPHLAQASPIAGEYDYSASPPYAPYTSSDPMDSTLPMEPGSLVERSLASNEPWTWQLMPTGLMYRSYLAGTREPRLGTTFVHERNLHWRWDSTLGGRVGLFRYGTDNEIWPQGYQFDIEGAAFPRLNLEHLRDLDTVDFRAGALITSRQGPAEMKFGYYHLSSHLGDEYVIEHPERERINYVRESLILGGAVYLNPSVRLYSELGYAFYVDGGAKPWEVQFGAECSSPEPTGPNGAPFIAVNCHLREENDFSGNMNFQTGWQWRGRSGHLLRIGVQYFNGMNDQAQFYDTFEEQIGVGLWYDY